MNNLELFKKIAYDMRFEILRNPGLRRTGLGGYLHHLVCAKISGVEVIFIYHSTKIVHDKDIWIEVCYITLINNEYDVFRNWSINK